MKSNVIARLGGYREYAAPDELRGIVSALWSYSRAYDDPPIPGEGHRLLPDTDLSLALLRRSDARGAVVDATLLIVGPIANAKFFVPDRGYHMDAIRLHPEWARDLLGVDPAEMTDELPELKRSPWFDRLVRASDPLGVLVDLVRERKFETQLSRGALLANAALRHLRRRAHPTLALDDIARTLSLSERHLRRVVRETAGFTPKQVQRIRRVGRAILAAERRAGREWADIAAACGFYDQPHMIQEFHAIAGCSPSQLLEERQQQMSEISNPTARAI